jgi:hypothetical protein
MEKNNQEYFTAIENNLNSIRETLDLEVGGASVHDVDIDAIYNKALAITQLAGLASESKSKARKILENARLIAIYEVKDEKMAASIMSKTIDAMCADELALYEYADRINASISHSLDTLRSCISLHKEYLNKSFYEPRNQ